MSALYFLTGFESKKLEQMVEENDFINKGKTVDALMMIRGIISSLCFVEIKTHETKLLDSNSYRAACWVASSNSTNSRNCLNSLKNLYGRIKPIAKEDDLAEAVIFNRIWCEYGKTTFILVFSK